MARACRARAAVGAQCSRPAGRSRVCRCAIRWRCARWSLILVVATFFAAGGERVKRITAAFDWRGVVTPANFRIDAWVTPPLYTGRPPVMLPGLRPGEHCDECRRAGRRAGRQSGWWCAPPAKSTFDVVREWRHGRCAARCEAVSAGRHRGAPLHHQARRLADRERRRPRRARSGPSAPFPIARRPSRWPRSRSRRRAARCGSTTSIEDDYGVVEAQATFALKDLEPGAKASAASALRRARIRAGAAAGAHARRRRARPPRI